MTLIFGGLIASTLDCGSGGLGLSIGLDQCSVLYCVFLGKTLYFRSASLTWFRFVIFWIAFVTGAIKFYFKTLKANQSGC